MIRPLLFVAVAVALALTASVDVMLGHPGHTHHGLDPLGLAFMVPRIDVGLAALLALLAVAAVVAVVRAVPNTGSDTGVLARRWFTRSVGLVAV